MSKKYQICTKTSLYDKIYQIFITTTMTPPLSLQPFLHAQGSLTALLEQQAGQALQVKIIHESYQTLDFTTKKLLKLPTHRPALAWVREVLLFGNDDMAWVRAKSVFPLSSLTGNAKRLRHLKRTPIGYVMFKKSRQLPHERTIFYDKNNANWGRNTVYDWQGRPILVQEVFLNSFENQ